MFLDKVGGKNTNKASAEETEFCRYTSLSKKSHY